MSDIATLHQQHGSTKQQLANERDQIVLQIEAHERSTKNKASQTREIEAAFLKNATLEALDVEPSEILPDANILEKLRADVAVGEPVSGKLRQKLAASETKLAKAEAAHKLSIAVYLEQTALSPAVAEFRAALDKLKDAAIDVMAAHHLAHRKFGNERFFASNAAELFGPVSEWLYALRDMNWPSYPYSIRPEWLPLHGRFWPDEIPGVVERMNELLAEVEQGT